eukprot:1334133-Pleurochrysis_carterae.AAC.1
MLVLLCLGLNPEKSSTEQLYIDRTPHLKWQDQKLAHFGSTRDHLSEMTNEHVLGTQDPIQAKGLSHEKRGESRDTGATNRIIRQGRLDRSERIPGRLPAAPTNIEPVLTPTCMPNCPTRGTRRTRPHYVTPACTLDVNIPFYSASVSVMKCATRHRPQQLHQTSPPIVT